MDINQLIRRANEISAIEAGLKHIQTVEWLHVHYCTILNEIENKMNDYLLTINNQNFRHIATNDINYILYKFQSLGEIEKFSVICDESNNPISVIDDNNVKIDICIKPLTYIDEWIYIPISYK